VIQLRIALLLRTSRTRLDVRPDRHARQRSLATAAAFLRAARVP
jgi:hypothetical protein